MPERITKEVVERYTQPLRALCEKHGYGLLLFLKEKEGPDGKLMILDLTDSEIMEVFQRTMKKMDIKPGILIHGQEKDN